MQLLKQDLTSLFIEQGRDWSSKSIIAALDLKGVVLSDIDRELAVKEGTVRNVFYRPCDRYEKAIAQKIGIEPGVIWPSRYGANNRLSA